MDPATTPLAHQKAYGTFSGDAEKLGSTATTLGSIPWISWLFFSFARPLLDTGSAKQLKMDDLRLVEGDSSTISSSRAFKDAYVARGNSVKKAIVAAYAWRMALCGLCSALTAACSLFAPAVLHQVIDLFASPSVDIKRLLVWVSAFYASRLINVFVEAHVNFQLELLVIQCTASFKALIFEKMTRLSIKSKTDDSVADIANLFTSDVSNLMWAGIEMNSAWIIPIQVALVVFMLYELLDLAAFAGLGVIFLFMLLNYGVAKRSRVIYRELMGHKDNRMRAVKEVFGGIQIVKFNAWEDQFLERIRQLRLKETKSLASYLYLSAVTTFFFWCAPLCVSIASFATYTLILGNELTAAKVFTAMVLFNSIRQPLSQFPEAVQTLLEAYVSLGRIAKFLATEEVSSDTISWDGQNYPSELELSVENASFLWNSTMDMDATSATNEDASSSNMNTDETRLLAASSQDRILGLSPFSLRIKRGDFVVVHGPVGSGKTSLCLALLGELPAQQGKVFVRSRNIAYYSQQPWIQNMTIRDNILFGLPYDKTKYERVLDACGLVKDVAMFRAGDATEIGQKGVNLSGGQKARVSLARACYADADVYILDTPLAAVDAVVQSEIFSKCLCGLLESKTVVLVTHLHDIIESEAANVKVLVEDGGVKVTYGDRKQSRRAYANLHTEAEDEEKAEEKDAIDDDTHKATNASGMLIEEEEREDGRVSSEVFKAYFDAVGGAKVLISFLVILIIWQSFRVSGDLWLSEWTGSEPGTIQTRSVEYNMLVYVLLGVGTGVFVLIRALILAYVGVNASRRLFDDMTRSLLHAPLRFFDANPIGRIINRYSDDMAMIDSHLPFIVFGMLISMGSCVFQLLTAVYVIQWAGLLILPLGFIYIRIGSFYLSTSREVSRLVDVSSSPVLSHLSQSEEGVAVLRAFGHSYVDRAIAENLAKCDISNRAWYVETVVNQWFAVRMGLVGFGVVVIIVSTIIALHEYLSPGLVGLAFMYGMNIDSQLATWIKSWSWLEMAMVSPERVFQYINIPSEGGTSQHKLIAPHTDETWPQSGSITFEDVKFAYKPGGDLVLKGLSFCIQHNEKIGIVGRTGAGKSSLTMALFRINELVSGRILLDGVDISTINLQTLRSRMSIIPQVPVLFKGSMRAYMDPFEEYSDAEIWCAFEKMGLKEMIGGLDGKLAHELSENGENFSVGERQMLCLARALLRRSRVVVMDEATASIDRATEAKLQEMIMREFVDATVLTIAHRLSTVLESDRILVLSDGRVEEFDSATALVRVEGGVFRELTKESGICGRSDEFF